MNDFDYGPTIQGDANSSALLSHQRRQDKADLAYEEREANAPADLYEQDAWNMIMTALTGGKDDIDITGCLHERFAKNCTSLGEVIKGCDGVVFATPDHLTDLVEWTVQDLIKDWVAHRVRDYAEDVL